MLAALRRSGIGVLLAVGAAGCASTPKDTPTENQLRAEVIARGPGCDSCVLEFELRGLRERSDSTLWLLYNVAARDWNNADDGSPALTRHPRRVAYDGVLDLRDVTTGKSLLRTWINLPLVQIVNDTLLADRRETDDGFWVIDIYRVRLHR